LDELDHGIGLFYLTTTNVQIEYAQSSYYLLGVVDAIEEKFQHIIALIGSTIGQRLWH